MKLVHVMFEPPSPEGSGRNLRDYALGLSLSRLGPSSTMIVQDHFSSEKRYPGRKRSFIEADLPREIVEDITRRIARENPDLVVVEGVYLADIAWRLLSIGQKVIVDMHNLESALLREDDIARRGWRARLFYRRRWKEAEAAEKRLAPRVAGVWVCSHQDAALLRAAVGEAVSIDVIPNPIPAWCGKAEISSPPEPWSVRALYVGHLGYRPNIRAAERLIRTIHPQLKQVFPDAGLDICGRSPGKKLQKLASGIPGLRLTGDPADLAPFYARATVALIPLREGGGTRLKVLEAMALGVPVVATAKAVEGLELVPGETYLAAETDADFVAAVKQLAADAPLRAGLIGAAHRYVRAHHDQHALDAAVRTSLARLSWL